MNWYIRVMRTGVNRGLNRGLYYSHFPTVTILYPPVEPFQKFSTYGNKKGNQMSLTTQDATVDDIKQLMTKKAENVRVISVFGRFFRGRQSKGHDVALTLFAQLVDKIPDVPLHLYLVGFVQPNSWDYVEDLKVNATRLGIRDKVFLYTNSTGEEVGHVLLKTTFLWHLAGVRWLREAQYFDNYEPAAVTHTVVLYGVINRPNVIAYDLDPASLEHFGIAIVEAMFSGVIPIVGALGGTTDIVQENFNGLYAEQIDDFVLHVERLLKGPTSEIERLSRNAISSANLFSTDTFMANIRYEVLTGIHTHRMRMTSRYHMKAVWRMADLNKVVFRGHSDNAFWFMAQGHLAEHDQQVSHAIQIGNKHYGHLRKRVGKRRKNMNKLFYHNSGVNEGSSNTQRDANVSESVFDKNSQANVAMTRYFNKEAYQATNTGCELEKDPECKHIKKTALLICTGITALLEMIVNNVLYYLGPGWSLTILSHRTADFFVRGTLKGLPNVQYIHLNNTIESRYDFDTTLTDPWFWSMFEPNEKVFIFDMDTLLLRRFDSKKFLSYDLVVGPTNSNCKTKPIVDNSIRKNGLSEFGIGALSLRTAGVMFDISARYTKTDVDESEASFFYRHLIKEGYKVSNEVESHDFSWGTEECPNDYSFELINDDQRPFGIHALWTYADNLTLVDHLVKTYAVPAELSGDRR
jgi:glycosyltransferase involved in cell wall biosynthesis